MEATGTPIPSSMWKKEHSNNLELFDKGKESFKKQQGPSC